MNQHNRPTSVASEVTSMWELLDRVPELEHDLAPGIRRSDAASLVGGGRPSGRITLEAILKRVTGQEPIDGQAIATNAGKVVRQASDCVKLRESGYGLQ